MYLYEAPGTCTGVERDALPVPGCRLDRGVSESFEQHNGWECRSPKPGLVMLVGGRTAEING